MTADTSPPNSTASEPASASITPDQAVTTLARASSGSTVITWVLVVVSSVLVVLATLAVGIQQVLLNTDRWVAVVGPLATNPIVQASMAETAATLTLDALDLQGRVQSLPTPVQSLAGPVEATLATFVDDQALHLVQSSQFAELWVGLNRTAHLGLVQLLRGETPADGAVRVTDGQVELNLLVLAPALLQRLGQAAPDLLAGQPPAGLPDRSTPPSQLRERLRDAVGHQLPADFGYVPLMEASRLEAAQRAVQLLDRVTWALVVAAVAAIVLTLIVSVERRLTALRLGVAVAFGIVLAALTLLAGQNRLLMSLAGRPIGSAAQAALGAVLVSLAQYMLIVFVVAGLIALVAYVAGPRARASVYDG
ncbi:MAG: hypothetical protein JO023_16320 [Chloroflexi bacterium]|nr:hypothetical protein [Chloroflexota bacterium]